MAKKEKRFVIDVNESSWGTDVQTIVDKETGVNYLFVKSGYGAGLTVLVDKDGRPVVTEKEA